jgi:hypothetical protein
LVVSMMSVSSGFAMEAILVAGVRYFTIVAVLMKSSLGNAFSR